MGVVDQLNPEGGKSDSDLMYPLNLLLLWPVQAPCPLLYATCVWPQPWSLGTLGSL